MVTRFRNDSVKIHDKNDVRHIIQITWLQLIQAREWAYKALELGLYGQTRRRSLKFVPPLRQGSKVSVQNLYQVVLHPKYVSYSNPKVYRSSSSVKIAARLSTSALLRSRLLIQCSTMSTSTTCHRQLGAESQMARKLRIMIYSI